MSQPLSRRTFSFSSAFRPPGIRPKSTLASPGPVGRNPRSRRIWRSGSISALVVPAWHTKSRIPGVRSEMPASFSSFAIRLVTGVIAPVPPFPQTAIRRGAGHAHSAGPRPTLVVYRSRGGRDPMTAPQTVAHWLQNAAGGVPEGLHPRSAPGTRDWQPDSQVGKCAW